MGKHPTKKPIRQGRGAEAPARVAIPRPLLATLEDAETAFFGLCSETGKPVLAAMMEEDRTVLCGPAGRHDRGRRAGRGGTTESAVVLGGRCRLPGPRVRAREGGELGLPGF